MTSQSISRKRPAPGASPIVPQPIQSVPNMPQSDSQLSNDQFLQWGQNGSSRNNTLNYDPSSYPPVPNPSDHQNTYHPQGQLTRRPAANQLVSRSQLQDPALLTSVDPAAGTRQPDQGEEYGETPAEIEQRALLAKKEAQAKRRQIPPFVQKLRSFLDESRNTELIRWSDDGNSFIVLDEDEFAKSLIPNLFKHNNYASFVRQLNMYGFHKKVGLSDNSMRASERKNKSPSEYSNAYFKRDKPDLLWLIQKPKSVAVGGKATTKGGNRGRSEADGEDENDDFEEETNIRNERAKFRGQLSIGPGEAALPKDQLANVYRELQNIRHQQQIISSTIGKLRREQEQLYGQAATFQEQHNRHENSINAILTFLATVYNRSLQGHEGAQGLVNSFSGAIPQEHNQGNVVDMGDFISNLDSESVQDQRPFKKQPLLLKAPPVLGNDGQPVRGISPATTASSQYDAPQGSRNSSHARRSSGIPANVEELFDAASPQSNTPQSQTQQQPPPPPPTQPQPAAAQKAQPRLPHQQYASPAQTPQQSYRANPQRDIMSLIQNSNARNNLNISDFPTVLSSLENSDGNSPLSSSQRADVLRMIASQNNASDPSTSTSANNALVTPTPPPMPQSYPSRLANNRAEIDNLVKMQAEQDKSVQNLTNLLQPLSPTGSIPGLNAEDPNATNVPPPPLDLDQIFNSDYFTDFSELDNNNKGYENFQGQEQQPQQQQQRNDTTKDSKPATTGQGNDLFDFDLPAGTSGDAFGGSDPAVPIDPQQRQLPEYYGNFGLDGTNDFDASLADSTAGLNFDIGAGGPGDALKGNDASRVTETFTSSEATSPANTSVDDNFQNPEAGNNSPASKKRRRNA